MGWPPFSSFLLWINLVPTRYTQPERVIVQSLQGLSILTPFSGWPPSGRRWHTQEIIGGVLVLSALVTLASAGMPQVLVGSWAVAPAWDWECENTVTLPSATHLVNLKLFLWYYCSDGASICPWEEVTFPCWCSPSCWSLRTHRAHKVSFFLSCPTRFKPFYQLSNTFCFLFFFLLFLSLWYEGVGTGHKYILFVIDGRLLWVLKTRINVFSYLLFKLVVFHILYAK